MKITMKLTYGRTSIENIIYCDPTKDELNKVIMNVLKAFQKFKSPNQEIREVK